MSFCSSSKICPSVLLSKRICPSVLRHNNMSFCSSVKKKVLPFFCQKKKFFRSSVKKIYPSVLLSKICPSVLLSKKMSFCSSVKKICPSVLLSKICPSVLLSKKMSFRSSVKKTCSSVLLSKICLNRGFRGTKLEILIGIGLPSICINFFLEKNSSNMRVIGLPLRWS